MSMKLSKKDIIMLIVLGVIMFVAIFYVYGIMPLQDKSKELDSVIADKQNKVQNLNNRLAALNTSELDKKRDEMLDLYFSTKNDASRKYVHEELGKIEIEKKMVPILKSYDISGFATTGWNTSSESALHEYDGQQITTVLKVARLNVSFQIKKLADFKRLINDFNENPDFIITDYNFVLNEKSEEEEDPEAVDKEFYECTGSFNVLFYMGEKYDSELLPSELPEVQNVQVKEGLTLTFDKLDNALTYEVYEVKMVDGVKTFTQLNHAAFSEVDGKMQVLLNASDFAEGATEAEIFVRAVGDRKEYYKSPMHDAIGGVKVTLVQ